MDKLTFSVWYDKKKDVCNLYELLERYSFFKPKEIYIDEEIGKPSCQNELKTSEIKKIFSEACKIQSYSCITISGYGFLLLIASTVNLGDFHIVSLDISPRILKNDYSAIERIFKEIVELTGAFYGMIDSIYNSGILFENENEDTYKPDQYIQALFWGNFFGSSYAKHPNVLKMVKSEYCISERVENGWFVKLSSICSEYDSKLVRSNRKKLRKYIKSIMGYHYIRFNNTGDGTLPSVEE